MPCRIYNGRRSDSRVGVSCIGKGSRAHNVQATLCDKLSLSVSLARIYNSIYTTRAGRVPWKPELVRRNRSRGNNTAGVTQLAISGTIIRFDQISDNNPAYKV